MPFKDPERKRQWEREHRDERNARRRTTSPAVVVDPSPEGVMPDLIPEQMEATGPNIIPALFMGFILLLILLFAEWRFRGVPEPSGHT